MKELIEKMREEAYLSIIYAPPKMPNWLSRDIADKLSQVAIAHFNSWVNINEKGHPQFHKDLHYYVPESKTVYKGFMIDKYEYQTCKGLTHASKSVSHYRYIELPEPPQE